MSSGVYCVRDEVLRVRGLRFQNRTLPTLSVAGFLAVRIDHVALFRAVLAAWGGVAIGVNHGARFSRACLSRPEAEREDGMFLEALDPSPERAGFPRSLLGLDRAGEDGGDSSRGQEAADDALRHEALPPPRHGLGLHGPADRGLRQRRRRRKEFGRGVEGKPIWTVALPGPSKLHPKFVPGSETEPGVCAFRSPARASMPGLR
jgi:hypothetical protein